MPLATHDRAISDAARARRIARRERRAQSHPARKAVLLGVAGVGGLLGPLAGILERHAKEASANVADAPSVPSAASVPVTPAPTAAPTAAPAEQSAGTYTVKSGDTIAKIAAAQGMRWDALAELNGVQSPFVIYPGQVLKLSGSASTPAPVHADRGGERQAPAAPAPQVSGSGKGAGAVAYMMQQLREGDRYVYGANGPSQWDCSSLTQAAWKSQGVNLPRTSAAQASAGSATTRAALKPGDLVRYPGHIAMYIGGDQVVHAVNAKTGLKVTSVTWAGTPTGYRSIG